MGTSQNKTTTYGPSESTQLAPQFISQSELTNKHTLDLQTGQHSSVEIIVPLPENSQVFY